MDIGEFEQQLARTSQRLQAVSSVRAAVAVLLSAEQLRRWAHDHHRDIVVENEAWLLRIRAIGSVTSMLIELLKHGGDRRSAHGRPKVTRITFGITRKQWERWRKIAAIPESAVDEYLASVNASRYRATDNGLMRWWDSRQDAGESNNDSASPSQVPIKFTQIWVNLIGAGLVCFNPGQFNSRGNAKT